MKPDHPILFIPGPTEVRPEILAILSRPQIGHRSEAMKDLVTGIRERLKPVFGTRAGRTAFESCPATALMEAGVRNLVRKRVLHLTCGAFSERWQEIARACGKEADAVSVPWGKANRAEELTQALATGQYDTVAITHNETATGVMNPLAELCAAARRFPDVMIMVDVVTSLGGAPVEFDQNGIDLAFASVQKGLALPAGFTVYAVSTRAIERARTVAGRGWLLDFARVIESLDKGQTLATPSIPHVFALDAQLRAIEQEGLPARFARHAEMAARTQDWGRRCGVKLYADPAFLSPTVTNFEAGTLDVDKLRKNLKQAGYQISDGYGKLKGRAFRIGHMGDHSLAVVDELLAVMDRALNA